MTLNILEITQSGAIDQLLKPAAAANTTAVEALVDIGIKLKNSLSEYLSLKPGRVRAAGLCGLQVGEDANIFTMYYVPEGSSNPVWRVFVNPIVKPVPDAQLLEDKNFSLSTLFVRTQIDRPDKVELTAALAFDIPMGITNIEDIRHACLENIRPNYQEVLHERMLTEKEMAQEGLKKPDRNGNAFIAQLLADKLQGISPIHHVPEAQVKAFVENQQSGPNLMMAGEYYQAKDLEDPNAGKLPTSEQLNALHEFYERGRPRVLAAIAQNAVGGQAPKGPILAT